MSQQQPIVNVLREIRDGALIHELPQQLQELVAAVRATGKKGSIKLKITVAQLKKGNNHTLIIEDDVEVKIPKPDRESTILYATETNELTRKDPRQPELTGLRDVTKVTQMPPAERAGASE